MALSETTIPRRFLAYHLRRTTSENGRQPRIQLGISQNGARENLVAPQDFNDQTIFFPCSEVIAIVNKVFGPWGIRALNIAYGTEPVPELEVNPNFALSPIRTILLSLIDPQQFPEPPEGNYSLNLEPPAIIIAETITHAQFAQDPLEFRKNTKTIFFTMSVPAFIYAAHTLDRFKQHTAAPVYMPLVLPI